jgi:hypothetical protein
MASVCNSNSNKILSILGNLTENNVNEKIEYGKNRYMSPLALAIYCSQDKVPKLISLGADQYAEDVVEALADKHFTLPASTSAPAPIPGGKKKSSKRKSNRRKGGKSNRRRKTRKN